MSPGNAETDPIKTRTSSTGIKVVTALCESEIGLYKTELIERRGPWRTPEEVELFTLEWVQWFNHRRLHSAIGNVPPVEFEEAYYRAERTENARGALDRPGLRCHPGRENASSSI